MTDSTVNTTGRNIIFHRLHAAAFQIHPVYKNAYRSYKLFFTYTHKNFLAGSALLVLCEVCATLRLFVCFLAINETQGLKPTHI